MEDKECKEVYNKLVDVLNQEGLQWVTTEVADQIRLGKTVEKEIDTLKESSFRQGVLAYDQGGDRLKRGPKATFPITVDYSKKEALFLLIDAIEHVVVNTAEMENQLFNTLAKEIETFGEIGFYSEEPNIKANEVSRRILADRLKRCRLLKQQLDSLRKEV